MGYSITLVPFHKNSSLLENLPVGYHNLSMDDLFDIMNKLCDDNKIIMVADADRLDEIFSQYNNIAKVLGGQVYVDMATIIYYTCDDSIVEKLRITYKNVFDSAVKWTRASMVSQNDCTNTQII